MQWGKTSDGRALAGMELGLFNVGMHQGSHWGDVLDLPQPIQTNISSTSEQYDNGRNTVSSWTLPLAGNTLLPVSS